MASRLYEWLDSRLNLKPIEKTLPLNVNCKGAMGGYRV